MRRHIKSVLAVMLAGLLLVSSAGAALVYDMEPLDRAAISQLSDDKLTETYIDLQVELEASMTFSRRAGFNQAEYLKFKKLLRFRYDLYAEIIKRELPVPPSPDCH